MPLNSKDGALVWATTLDTSGLERGTKRAQRAFSDLTAKAKKEGEEMERLFKRMGAALASYFTFTAGKQFISDIIRVRGEFQQLDIALQTMLGSKEKADKMMADIVDLSTRSPFTLRDVADNTKQVIAMGIAVEDAVDTVRRLGDVSSGVGVPLSRLAVNYGQVATLGKLQTREIKDFAMAGVPIVEELAKMMGKTKTEVQELVTAGEVGFPLVEEAFKRMTSEGGKFANLMEKQVGSVTGQISLLRDAFDRMLNSIGQANEGSIYKGINALRSLVENYETVIDILKVLVATYGSYKAIVIATSVVEKVAASSGQIKAWFQLARGIKTAKDAQIAFNLASSANPWGAIAAALGLVVSTLLIFNRRQKEAIGVSSEFKDNLKKEVEAIKKTFEAVKKAKEGTEQRRKAIEDINTKYKDYLPNLVSEKAKLEDVEKAQQKVTEALAKSIALKAQEAELNKASERTGKKADDYTKTASNFAVKVQLDNEAKGQFYADLENLVDELANYTELSLEDVGSKFRDVMRDYDIEIGTFFNGKNLAGGNIIEELKTSIYGYVLARKDEKQTIDDLDQVYTSYLKKLGIIQEKTKDDAITPGPDPIVFNLEAFKQTLKQKYDAYEAYTNDVAQLGVKQANRNHKQLLDEYGSFEEYLEKQLTALKNNKAAQTAIAEAASKAGITLNLNTELETLGLEGIDLSQEFQIDTKTLKSVDELKKLWEALGKAIKRAIKIDDQVEFGNNLADAGGLLQEMAQTAGFFDQELSRVLGTAGNLATSLGTVVANWSSNPLMAATGVFGALSTIVSLFDDSAKKQAIARDKAQAMLDILKLQNIALERQIDLMNEAAGIDRIGAEADTMALIQQQIDELNKQAGELKIKFKKGDSTASFFIADDIESLEKALSDLSSVKLPKWYTEGLFHRNRDDFQDFLDQGWSIDNLSDLQSLISEYDKLIEKRRELIATIIDSTADGLTDSLMEGLESGLTAVEAFANTFEDAMKRAILQSFEVAYIAPLAAEMMDQIYKIMQESKERAYGQKTLDDVQQQGDLTDDEFYKALIEDRMNAINIIMKDRVSEIGEQWGILQDLFNELGLNIADGEEGLAGAIKKGLTEETASVMAGLWNVISIDVRQILNQLYANSANSTNYMTRSIELMIDIEANTRRTADNTNRLENIEQTLKDIKSQGENTTDDSKR